MRKKMRAVDVAYLAGIIDGEGHICIFRRESSRNGNKAVRIFPVVGITNSNLKLLKWVRKSLGFGYMAKREKSKIGTQIYFYRVSYSSVIPLIELVLPYLKVKKKNAELILAYAKYRRSRSYNEPYSSKDEEFFLRYKNLKEGKHG